MKCGLESILFLSIIALFIGCSFQNDQLREIDDLIEELHSNNEFDGSIVIGNKSGVVYAKSIGLAVREWNTPITDDTRFDIASLNKSFVGYMIMQLVESGKIDLNEPLTSYLDFNGMYGDEITIHQMLTHTSGLPDYNEIDEDLKARGFEKFKRTHFEDQDYVRFIGSLGPNSSPGEQFYYSNFAYHLLSLIIEKVEGKHFSKVLDSMICRPLKLENTYAPLNNRIVYDRLAASYQLQEGKYEKSPFIDYSIGRRIFSTTKDLYKWGKEVSAPQLISNESQQKLLTNHIKALNPSISYGYGWAVFDGKGEYEMGKLNIPGEYVIHGGATDGYRSLLIIYNGGEWTIALLGNIGSQFNELETAEKILKILINNEL